MSFHFHKWSGWYYQSEDLKNERYYLLEKSGSHSHDQIVWKERVCTRENCTAVQMKDKHTDPASHC